MTEKAIDRRKAMHDGPMQISFVPQHSDWHPGRHPDADGIESMGRKIDKFFVKAVNAFMLFLVGVAAGYFWAVAAYGVLK